MQSNSVFYLGNLLSVFFLLDFTFSPGTIFVVVFFRLQRMHILAQSQPNLLDLLDNEDEANEEEEEEVRRDVATLSKALSNPNLLDSSSYQDSCKV
jgi:hypothetical protein